MTTTPSQIPTITNKRSTRARLDYSRWYVIQIQPNLHKFAHYHLTRQGFQSFFPTILIRANRLQTARIEPLFKGYAFVYFDPTTTPNWKSINGTKGVVSLVPKHQLIPNPVPRGFVEFLIDHDPITEILFDQTFDEYYPGSTVTIKSGEHVLQKARGTVISDRGRYVEIMMHYDHKPNYSILISKESLVPQE